MNKPGLVMQRGREGRVAQQREEVGLEVVDRLSNKIGDLRDLLSVKDSYYQFLSAENVNAGTKVYNLEVESGCFTRRVIQDIPSGPVGVYGIDDVEVFGSHYVGRSGSHVFFDQMTPTYVPNFIKSGAFPDAKIGTKGLTSREIDYPVFMICSRQSHIYGHFILEMLPKLLFVDDICRALRISPVIIVEDSTPSFVGRSIEIYMPHAKILKYKSKEEFLRVRKLIVPTTLGKNHTYHPAMKGFVSRLRDAALSGFHPDPALKREISSSAGIFISRAKHRAAKGWDSRFLTNEEDLLRFAKDMGLFVFEPQEFSYSDQVYIFSEASCIIGEFSSALHNAIFRHRECRVISFDRMNNVQECIAQLCKHDLIQILPTERNLPPPSGKPWHFTVPVGSLEAAMTFSMDG